MQWNLEDTTNLLVWAQAPHWGRLGGKKWCWRKKKRKEKEKKKNTVGRTMQAKR